MINILMSGNNNVKDGLLIVVLSYIKHNSEPVTIYFETMDFRDLNPKYLPITENNVRYIESLLKKANPESSIKIIDCSELFKSTMPERLDLDNIYTPYSLLRILADKLDIPDKILYLDTDIMILSRIDDLFSFDVSDTEFAAVIDYLGKTWISSQYQNSGVMLMNIRKIRETGFLEKCRKYISKNKSPFLDQDALNRFVTAKVYLPNKFNEQHKRREDTVIRHFSKTIKWFPFFHTQNIKPWMVGQVHSVMKTNQYDDILNEYLELKNNLD